MSDEYTYALGNVVEVRDEEWLVTSVDASAERPVLYPQDVSDLVRGQDADFHPFLDRIIRLNVPRNITIRPDVPPRFRRSRHRGVGSRRPALGPRLGEARTPARLALDSVARGT